jgi:cyclohexadieny/prephenate dehydrogenase
MAADAVMFQRVAIVGVGLIGSSLARVIRREGLARTVIATDRDPAVCAKVTALGIADAATPDLAVALAGADLVLLCTPVGSFRELGPAIAPHCAPGAIVSDVGSVKQVVLRDIGPCLPEGVHLVPGHPVAGTEFSGPEAGFADLFEGRWCILTPPPGTNQTAVDRMAELWRRCGSMVEFMEPSHHDRVLAITSHLPHLIAYTIVDTAQLLAGETDSEVIKFSAGGFRDFTRIAASDPIMWRDVFLNNREAVLDILQRFSEDLMRLQRAIRWGEGEILQEVFTRTREVRRRIIDARQA